MAHSKLLFRAYCRAESGRAEGRIARVLAAALVSLSGFTASPLAEGTLTKHIFSLPFPFTPHLNAAEA